MCGYVTAMWVVDGERGWGVRRVSFQGGVRVGCWRRCVVEMAWGLRWKSVMDTVLLLSSVVSFSGVLIYQDRHTTGEIQ